MVKSTPETEGRLPDKEAFAEMGRFNMELAEAGMILAMDGLQPSSKGAQIAFSNGKRAVTDGPFTEAKELVAGFWIIQAKSKEDAIAWMSRAPFENGRLEIRQLYDVSDFPPGLIEKEKNKEVRSLIDRANAELKPS
jgi:hypothetical protein